MLPRRYSSSLVVSSMKDLHWQLYSHAATLVLCQPGLFVRHGIKYQWMKHEVRFPFSFHWRLYSQDNILVLMTKWPGSHCLLCRQRHSKPSQAQSCSRTSGPAPNFAVPLVFPLVSSELVGVGVWVQRAKAERPLRKENAEALVWNKDIKAYEA